MYKYIVLSLSLVTLSVFSMEQDNLENLHDKLIQMEEAQQEFSEGYSLLKDCLAELTSYVKSLENKPSLSKKDAKLIANLFEMSEGKKQADADIAKFLEQKETIELQYFQEAKKQADALVSRAQTRVRVLITLKNEAKYENAVNELMQALKVQQEATELLDGYKQAKQKVKTVNGDEEFAKQLQIDADAESKGYTELAIEDIQDEDFARQLQEQADAELAKEIAKN